MMTSTQKRTLGRPTKTDFLRDSLDHRQYNQLLYSAID